MYNVASAYDKGGDLPRAIEWYGRYLGANPGTREAIVAKARVEILERERL